VALSALRIGPRAVPMGGALPLLTHALSRSVAESTRVQTWIYAANTAGAFAEALAGGFALVPRIGLDGVLRAMGGVSSFAGAVFLAQSGLDARRESERSLVAFDVGAER
jgi:hypothetical protein